MNMQAGPELKKVREARGLSLEEAARDLCLRADVLRELESAEEERSLPDVYRKLSLRMYARYLDVAFNASRDEHRVELSPVNSCVELAYSDRMRDEPAPKKRRTVGAGTVLAATAVLILTTGLWSLNAKISRLNSDGKPPRAPAPVVSAPAGWSAPRAVNAPLRLEDTVSLTLTPDAPATAAPGTPEAP